MKKYKYPAHSTEPYIDPTPAPRITPPVWVVYLGVVCLFVLIGTTLVGSFWISDRPPAAAAQVSTQIPMLTNTPEPSTTPEPTRTPYPTFSPTIPISTNVENDILCNDDTPAAVYIVQEVTLEVTRLVTVERIITGTPQPATREPSTLTPTPNATQTQAAFITGIENSTTKRNNLWRWAGLFASVGIGAIVIGMGIGAALSIVLPQRPTIEDTTETAADILTVNDARRDREILRYHRAGWTKRKIQLHVFKYSGGGAADKVDKVIDEYNASLRTTPPPTEDYTGEGVA